MYVVEVYHHKKGWRNGDLEDAFELINKQMFKTRAGAKAFIERNLTSKDYRDYHKGDKTSYCYHYTGETWIHENTGEKMQEYYQYVLKKAVIK